MATSPEHARTELAADDSKQRLRLWLKLLGCTNMVERDVRDRLRRQFDVTLPRFDLMSALERQEGGLTMGALSKHLMVSNGNVTGVVDRLEKDGLVQRASPPGDRRSYLITLTADGKRAFAAMAARHESWIAELFGTLEPGEVDALIELLERAKSGMSMDSADEEEPV
jgi:DNA-binding MarR family transcriptional regulator